MKNTQVIIDKIVEKMQEGIRPDNMTLHLSLESYGKLVGGDVPIVSDSSNDTEIGRILGVSIVPSENTELEYRAKCNQCESDKIFHDTKNKWMCPWCEKI